MIRRLGSAARAAALQREAVETIPSDASRRTLKSTKLRNSCHLNRQSLGQTELQIDFWVGLYLLNFMSNFWSGRSADGFQAAEVEISNRVKLCIDNSPMGAHGGSFCGSC